MSRSPSKLVRGAYGSDVSVSLVLLEAAGNGEEKHDVPRDADFSPHLQVDVSDTGVQASTHENVVNETSGHTNGLSGNDGGKVHEERDKPAPEHSDGHKVAEVVDDAGQAEDVEVVQAGSGE